MARASNPLVPQWYVLNAERGQQQPTRFKIRPLSGVEMNDLEMHPDSEGNYRIPARSASQILCYALLDWENFAGEDGPLPFDRGDPRANVQRLSHVDANELVNEIINKTVLQEKDRKNLSSPPTSAPTGTNSDAQPAVGGGTATIPGPQAGQSGG